MENVFLTSLTTPEVRQLFRHELEIFFSDKSLFANQQSSLENEKNEFTISELAAYLNCTKATVHAYKNRGVLKYYQTGRTVYFKKSEVDEALAVVNKKGAIK